MSDARAADPASKADETALPPAIDPELIDALAATLRDLPARMTYDALLTHRKQAVATALTDDALCRNGAFSVRRHVAHVGSRHSGPSLLVCRPTAANGPTAVLYYIHGGGMIMGSNRGNDLAPMLDLADELGLTVISVDYRLAPEHPHPAPVEDCYAGLLWSIKHAVKLAIDPARLVVAGASAGGGLAAATALLARDRGGPDLRGQLLMSPMLDDRNDSYSSRQMIGSGFWDQRMNAFGWTALLGEQRGTAKVEGYAAPARAHDLGGLPPAFLDVGSSETFRDEVASYASRIWQAGGNAELHVWPGGFHGYAVRAPTTRLGSLTRERWRDWLSRILDPVVR
jgi:acetyl esterase/lipase